MVGVMVGVLRRVNLRTLVGRCEVDSEEREKALRGVASWGLFCA